jgi:tetratricopeptide (TPR) repeat protein
MAGVVPVRVLLLLLTSALTLSAASAQFDWNALPLETYPEESRTQIASARDAFVAAPTNAAAAGELGLVLHAWEQYNLAAEAYAEARRLAPADVDWWVFSALLSTRVAQHALAAEYFGKAVALKASPLLSLRRGDALLDSGQLPEARAAYEAALNTPDASPSAHYGLGRVAVASGDTATARKEFEEAIALVPAFGAAHYALAQLQRKAGDLAAARASIARQQACLACWPMPPDPWSSRLAAIRSDATAFLRRGVRVAGSLQEDVDAIALHEQALARNGSLLQARVNLITLYARTGNLPKAEEQYLAVTAAGTQLAEAHHAYGLAVAASGNSDKAEPILRAAVEANPLDAAAHNALGLIHESKRRFPEAETDYARAVESDPRVRSYRFNYARVLTNTGRLDEALTQLARLHMPDDAEAARYVYATSAVYARKGDLDQARKFGMEALERARRHGVPELAGVIERELQKLK